ncbi:raffinose/stachyose/melibiose transport system substrate-binding protein [Arthrobacter sp. 31Cvi3.1E]|nr:raffinose/stachyose/melibiose transport system substrate-binding protein [Arthrobacter sp. 31Cvi3.1E]
MKLTNKRSMRTALLAALAAGSLVLTGCGGSSGSTSGEQTLTILEKWPEPQHQAFFEKVVADFEAANPGVKVELNAIQDEPYKERIRVLTASKTLPDIFFAWPGKYGEQFLDAGMAADLSPELARDGWGASLAPGTTEAYTHNGKTYGVPISLSGKYMIYNKELFAKAGVSVPSTLQELLTACSALKASGVQPIAFGNQAGWPGVHYLTTLLAKYVPADVLEKDFEPSTASFTDPGYEKALSTLSELSTKCFTSGANGISNDSTKAELQTGKAAMAYLETNNFSLFSEKGGATPAVAANWDFFRFPEISGAGGDQKSLTGAPDGLLVNANSKNKELAVKFLRFLTSQENGKLELDMRGRPSSVIGAEKGATLTPQLNRAIADMNATDKFNIWLDTATAPQVAQAFKSAAQAAVDGSSSPSKIMDTVRAASAQSK